MLFHIFPDTVADNGWKNHMSSNFVFSELKNGGSKAGVPHRDRRSRWGVPLLETPPFFNEKRQNYANLVFSTIFRNVTGKNVKHDTFFNF